MRSAALGMATVLLIGLGLLAWRGLANDELDAVRPGIAAVSPVATLRGGEELCQRPIDIDKTVKRIGLAVYNGPNPGAELAIRVNAVDDGGRELERFTIPKGWVLAPKQYYGLELPTPLRGDQAIEVCARNESKTSIELYGSRSVAGSALYDGNEETGTGDWGIYFPLLPDERRTLLGTIPDIIKRASVLRPGIVTPVTYVVLGLMLLIGAPVLLYRAVRASAD